MFRRIFEALAIIGFADTMTFNFNSLSDGANSSTIQNYMQAILNANSGGTITVSGAVAEQNYSGDNHVIGNTFNNVTWSNTLGTSDGATGPLSGQRNPGQSGYYDTFLVNNNFVTNGSDRITVTFTLPDEFQIDSVSFDYEIFPNAQCPGGSGNSHCGTTPDFTFKADGVTKLFQLASKPVKPNGDNSPLGNSETAWQFIGVSGLININDTNNVTTFEFIDWPAEIGIDNLVVNYHRPPDGTTDAQVPEPATLPPLASGFIGLSRYNRLRRRISAI